MDYTVSRSSSVGTSLIGEFDFEPPVDSPNATMADLKRFEREERAFNTYREHGMAICATCTKVSVQIFRTE